MTTQTPASAPPLDDPLVRETVESMGRFFEGFGFRRHLGRVWMTLYLADEPMTQPHVQDACGLSAGMVSTLLRELVSWGAVKTRAMPSSRQTWYEAETDLLSYVGAIIERRDLATVHTLDVEVARTIAALEARGTPSAQRLVRRLQPIRDLASLYESMATLVVRLSRGPGGAIRRGIGLVRGLDVR